MKITAWVIRKRVSNDNQEIYQEIVKIRKTIFGGV